MKNTQKVENTENTDKKLKNGKNLFQPGFDPRRNYKGRPKGARNWHTDFQNAIKDVAQKTGKTESEIRTALLARGVQEAMKGESKFWTYIIDREYGKVSQPIEGDLGVHGADELARSLQNLLDTDENVHNNKEAERGA